MRKQNIAIILTVLFAVAFISGIIVSTYEIFPHPILKFIEHAFTNDTDVLYYQNDVNSLIHINNESSITKTRNDLIEFIWKQSMLPKNFPEHIENNIIDERYNDLQNLESIDKLVINMNYDIDSVSYLFNPKNSTNELIIYHQGHKGDFIQGKETIQYFLDNNYSVLTFSMPLLGMNNQPIIEHSQFGKIKIQSHNQLELLENENFSPIRLFFEPVIASLNYIEYQYDFNYIHMVGISGGGWTTTLIAALDDRIDNSFSVAGSYPMFLRGDPKNFGDYEQHHLELYQLANYLDLYVMASYGENRKFVQIFNKSDPCCFDGDAFLEYEKQVQETVYGLGKGSFEIYLDETHAEHIISNNALEIIDNELTRN